jgi:hypothetical protein
MELGDFFMMATWRLVSCLGGQISLEEGVEPSMAWGCLVSCMEAWGRLEDAWVDGVVMYMG